MLNKKNKNAKIKSIKFYFKKLPKFKQPNFKMNWCTAIIPIIFMITGIIVDSIIDPSTNYPPLWLIGAGIIGLIISYFSGKKWNNVYQGLIDFLKIAWFPILFLISIGIMTTIWRSNGLIPSIIYYTANILRPEFLIPTAFIVGAIFSSVTGSSWTTFGTLGAIVLSIVDQYHDLMLLLVASGAIMSGSYFGDRISPISDTTIYPATNSKVGVMSHVKVSLPVVIISALISLALFIILGFIFSKKNIDISSNLKTIRMIMDKNMIISGWLISPLLLFIPLIIFRVNILAIIWSQIALGITILFGIQHVNFFEAFEIMWNGKKTFVGLNGNSIGTLISNSNSAVAIEQNLEFSAFKVMKSSGALGSSETLLFVLSSLFFASTLKINGTFEFILNKIYKLIKGPKSLIVSSWLTGVFFSFASSDQSVGCNINPTFYVDIYDKKGINRLNLSRATDNTSTVLVPLMPWSSDRAAFVDRALGGTSLMGNVSTINYLTIGAFSFFNWLTPLIAILFVIFDIFQVDANGKIKFRGGLKSYSKKTTIDIKKNNDKYLPTKKTKNLSTIVKKTKILTKDDKHV